MKKFFLSVVLAGLVVSGFAANERANNIRMVSYFPVPYVTYRTVNVSDTLTFGNDVTGTIGSNMNASNTALGIYTNDPSDASSGLLSINRLTLNNYGSTSVLSLASLIVNAGESLLPSPNYNPLVPLTLNSTFSFNKNLLVEKFTAALSSLEASTSAAIQSLYVFPDIFSGSGSSGQIKGCASPSKARWKTLQIKNGDTTSSVTYLVCE